MGKLKLNLDEIKVESFETILSKEKQSGTVNAQVSGFACEPTEYLCELTEANWYTCGYDNTCVHWWSCDDRIETCGLSQCCY